MADKVAIEWSFLIKCKVHQRTGAVEQDAATFRYDHSEASLQKYFLLIFISFW